MLLSMDHLVDKMGLKMEGVIHIGAHHGQEVEEYLTRGVSDILLFEPQMGCYEILESKFKDSPEVKMVNKALGSSDGKMVMYTETANNGQSSSLLKPVLHLQQYPHIVFNGTSEVDVTTLDEYFNDTEDVDINNYNTINIDVQGYELEVFKGARESLKNIDFIITEINRAEVYENCAMAEDLDEFLGSQGFSRRVTTWDGMIWGDAFYTRLKK